MKTLRKIFVPFSLGIVLSLVPITAFAASGKTFNLRKMVLGACPETLTINIPGSMTIYCTLAGESPDTGDGVSVCAYICSEVGSPQNN